MILSTWLIVNGLITSFLVSIIGIIPLFYFTTYFMHQAVFKTYANTKKEVYK